MDSYSQDNKQRLLSDGKLVIFGILLAACCMFVPAAFSGFAADIINIWAFAIIATGIAFMFMLVRRLAYSVTVCIFCFYTLFLLPDARLTATVMSFMLIFVIGALVCSTFQKKKLPLLLLFPAVIYLVAFALTRDPITALLSLVFIPSAAATGILQRKGAERKTVIIVGTVILIAIALGGGAALLYANGMLDRASIASLLDTARARVLDALTSMTADFGEVAIEIEVFNPTLLPAAVDAFFNTLPGFAVSAIFVILYFFHSVLFALYKSEDLELFINSKTSSVQMSTLSAVLFIAAYVFSFTTNDAGRLDIVGAVAENLRLILTPGLVLAGFGGIGALLRKLKLGRFFLILLLFAAFMWLTSYILLVLAAFGAIYIIITDIDKWAEQHYKKNQN